MSEGTSLIRFQRQFVDALAARVTNVSYQSPMQAADMVGADGSGVALWWSDDVNANVDIVVMVGDSQIWFDERYVATLRIQGLGLDTDDDQYACDQRANEAFGEVMRLLSFQSRTEQLADLDTDELEVFDYVLDGWSRTGGVLGENMRAARFEVRIAVHARVKIGA